MAHHIRGSNYDTSITTLLNVYQVTMMKNQQFPLGGFTLSRNFNLSKHVDFMRVNKIGAINGKPRGNVKVEPAQLSFMFTRAQPFIHYSILFTRVKFYVPMHVKFTRQGNQNLKR